MGTGSGGPSITSALRLMRATERLQRQLGRDPTREELAESLGMPVDDLSRLLDDLTRTPIIFRPTRRPGSG